MRRLRLVSLLALWLACLAGGARAQSTAIPAAAGGTPLRFALDWAFQGPTAMFLVAADSGAYAAHGLAVSIERGYGSADAINKLATGTADLGFADLNSLIEFNARNLDPKARTPIAVMIGDDASPLVLVALRRRGIKTPADLAGRSIAAPVFDAAYRLFPLFAAANGLDAGTVKWLNVKAELRQPMLLKGVADATAGSLYTLLPALESAKLTERDLTVLPYAGLGIYGHAVIARAEFLEAHPQAVAGFLAAVVQGLKATLADRSAAVAAVARRDPAIDPVLERRRLDIAIDRDMLTETVRQDGFGGVRPERLARNIRHVADALQLLYPPKPEQVFTDRFLPAAAERHLP